MALFERKQNKPPRDPKAEEKRQEQQPEESEDAIDTDIKGVRRTGAGAIDAILGRSAPGALFYAKMEQASKMQPIGKEELLKAMDTLRKYQAGKANFERRVIENEQWWKLRHWEYIKEQGTTDLKTRSSWLVNVILSKHADASDAYPSANFLPRARDDQEEAKKLSSIVPCIMEQTDFRKVWEDNWWKKLIAGVGVYGVFWDKDRLNGLGDVAITKIDPLKIYWEPGITDIQDSRNIFLVTLVDNDMLEEEYPQLKDKLGGKTFTPSEYLYDDTVNTSDKSAVIDWYYHKGGKLHYCKFVNDQVLYSTENDASPTSGAAMQQMQSAGMQQGEAEAPVQPQTMAERGLYDHGKYPFVFDALFPEEGTPTGFGYIDLDKDPQRQIDLMNDAIVANCIAVATPRWFVRGDGGINEEEFADWSKPFVHVQGNIDDQTIKGIQCEPLNSNYIAILQNKIAEMKETSGNRDVNNGGAPAGVTAASAIAAMQEQSGKLSRDQISSSYRCFKRISLLVVELIRQFYTAPREFRIMGTMGMDFLSYDNAGLQGVAQGVEFGVPMGMRNPIFDIDVQPQRESSYSEISNNELMLQLYGAGLLDPANCTKAMIVLDQMTFKGKEEVVAKIQALAPMYDMFLQFQMMQQQRQMGGAPAPAPAWQQPREEVKPDLSKTEGHGAENASGNHYVEKAKAQAQAATQPR